MVGVIHIPTISIVYAGCLTSLYRPVSTSPASPGGLSPDSLHM